MIKLLLPLLLVASTALGNHKTLVIAPELSTGNMVVSSQQVTRDSVDFDLAVLRMTRASLPDIAPIYYMLNSYGGDVDAGYIFIKEANSIPNLTIICVKCASMASAILADFKGPRLVLLDSQMLLHEMRAWLTAANLKDKKLTRAFSKYSDKFNSIFYKRLKLSRKAYERKILNQNWILSPAEIIEGDLADGLAMPTCTPELQQLTPLLCGQ